jgi:hypothetical protein
MNDSELISKLIDKGYVFKDSYKFYRTIQNESLSDLLSKLEELESKDVVNNKTSLDASVLGFIKDIRDIVVGDEGYLTSSIDARSDFVNILKEIDETYLVSYKIDTVNNMINGAKESIRDREQELVKLKNTVKDDIQRTKRTMEIFSEITELKNKIGEYEAEKETLENKYNVFKNIDEVELRDRLQNDIRYLREFVLLNLNLSDSAKSLVRESCSKLLQNVLLLGNDRKVNDSEEAALLNHFGLAKGENFLKQREDNAILKKDDEPEKEAIYVNDTYAADDIVVENEPVNTPNIIEGEFRELSDTNNNDEKDGFYLDKEILVYTGAKFIAVVNFERVDYSQLVKGAEYEVVEKRNFGRDLRLKGIDGWFSKTTFVTKEKWAEMQDGWKAKYPDAKVVYIGEDVPNLKQGTEYEIEEFYADGTIKLKGVDGSFIANDFVSKQKYESVNITESPLKEEQEQNIIELPEFNREFIEEPVIVAPEVNEIIENPVIGEGVIPQPKAKKRKKGLVTNVSTVINSKKFKENSTYIFQALAILGIISTPVIGAVGALVVAGASSILAMPDKKETFKEVKTKVKAFIKNVKEKITIQGGPVDEAEQELYDLPDEYDINDIIYPPRGWD